MFSRLIDYTDIQKSITFYVSIMREDSTDNNHNVKYLGINILSLNIMMLTFPLHSLLHFVYFSIGVLLLIRNVEKL